MSEGLCRSGMTSKGAIGDIDCNHKVTFFVQGRGRLTLFIFTRYTSCKTTAAGYVQLLGLAIACYYVTYLTKGQKYGPLLIIILSMGTLSAKYVLLGTVHQTAQFMSLHSDHEYLPNAWGSPPHLFLSSYY
jgi:hypothetical protein